MDILSEDDLKAAIAGADAPLRIIGGGTRAIGNPVEGTPLSVAGLTGVSLYEPGALTLVVRAGTPLSEIDALLEAEGQRLAFEPMDHRGLLGTAGEPTIGGVVAANISGPRRVQAGACRDFLLGVRFVDGSGRVLKNGGRVMKNVTGYDLVKLMAGSWGTLGVLSEVALKVLPKAEAALVLLIEGLDDRAAVAALSASLGSPFDVTGAAHAARGPDGGPLTMIRLEGFADSVAYRAGKLRESLAGDVRIETDPARAAALWRWLRDVAAFHRRAGDVWRISLKPSDAPEAGARLRTAFDADLIYDWGGGLVWALVPAGSDLRPVLAGLPGHARIERAAQATRAALGAFPSEGPALDRITAALRAKFDPRGILNPGLMAPKPVE
ncbi:MAG: FAD-binding protein [Rhodobacteraceae bacterium]|nr:FAD-binding protein [Paracoccaceae bacterium]